MTTAESIGPTGRVLPDFPTPEPLTAHGPARIVAMVNQKGGVGKTTSTVSLGAALAEYGRRVLLVDFDPQGALSVALGIQAHLLDRSVYNLLMDDDCAASDVIVQTSVPGLDLVPSNIDLSAAEVALVNEVAREQALARALAPVVAEYDFIIIDCQPSLGLLTVNALTAADGVVIPLECEYFALRGAKLLMDTIVKVRSRLNPRLQVIGVLGTMYDARTLHTREVLARVVDAFGDDVFHTVISRTIKFPDATVAGEPITTFASSSPAADAYRQLAREFLSR
ncbi:MAG: ParA family protein [Candidatus Nanopelagicales bacterium]